MNEGAKGIGVVSGGWRWRWWGYFIKLSLQNFQLAWKVGTTCSTRTMLEMQRSGTASYTRNGSGGAWRSVVGSVIKYCNGRIQQCGCMFKFTNTRGLHA